MQNKNHLLDRLIRPLAWAMAFSLAWSVLPIRTWAQDSTDSSATATNSDTSADTPEESPWIVTINTNKRILEVPFNKADPTASTATITAKVVNRTTNQPVADVKVFFSSGNAYFPDATGKVDATANLAVTDGDGEAVSQYTTNDSPFEDIVDLYATTFFDQENLALPIYSSPYQLVNNNLDVTSSPAIESLVAAEEQLASQAPSTGGAEERTVQDTMSEVQGKDSLKVEMDAQLGATDNSQGYAWIAVKVNLRAAASKTIADGNQNPPSLGSLSVKFVSEASDGNDKAMSFKDANVNAIMPWTYGLNQTGTEESDNQVLTWGADKSVENVMYLNQRAWGERDIKIDVQLVSRNSSNKDMLSSAGAKLNDAGDYVLSQQQLTFKQTNPDQPQVSAEIKADPETIGKDTQTVTVNGQVLLDGEPSRGRVSATVSSSDQVIGQLSNSADRASNPDGKFTMQYTPKQDGKSRDITISFTIAAADEMNGTALEDVEAISQSVVIHQGDGTTADGESTTSERVLIDKVTDGTRTLSVYGKTKQAAFGGGIKPYSTKSISSPTMIGGGGGLFSVPFFTNVNVNQGFVSSGTRTVDLNTVDVANYVPLLVEVTDNGQPAMASLVNAKVVRSNKNIAGETHLLAGENIQQGFFFGGSKRSDQADLTAELNSAGSAAFYYAPGTPDDWSKVRERGVDANGNPQVVDIGQVKLTNGYLDAKTGAQKSLELTLNLDIFSDKSLVSKLDKGTIKVTPQRPKGWTAEEDTTYGGFGASYEEMLALYHAGEITEDYKQYLEDQIAWTINIKIEAPTDNKDWKMPDTVVIRSTPEGDFIKMDPNAADDSGWLGKLQTGSDSKLPIFTPEPLIATSPGEFDQLQNVTGWFNVDINDQGIGQVAFIPAQSPRQVPSTIYVFYADVSTGTVEKSVVIDERPKYQSDENGKDTEPQEEIKPTELLTKDGVRIKFSAQKYEVTADGKDKTILDIYIDPTMGSKSGLIPGPSNNPMYFALGWDGPRGTTKVLSKSGVYEGILDRAKNLDAMMSGADPNYVWQIPNNAPSELHMLVVYDEAAMLPFELAQGIKVDNPSIYYVKVGFDRINKAELGEGGKGERQYIEHKTKTVTIKKVVPIEAEAGTIESHYEATMTINPDRERVPLNGTATALVEIKIKDDPATQKQFKAATDPIHVDFTVEGPAVFIDGQKTYTVTIPANSASGKAEVKIKAESDDAYQKSASVSAKYRIEPTGEKKKEGVIASPSRRSITFGAADGTSDDDTSSGDDGDDTGTNSSWFDSDKPLSNINTGQSLDSLNNKLQSSSYLSDARKSTIQGYINELKKNPANWSDIFSKISSELNQATLGRGDDQAVKDLWKALGDTILDFTNQKYRNDTKKSEVEKKEFDQAVQQAKSGNKDPIVTLRQKTSLDYYTGFAQAMGAYNRAGLDMLNLSKKTSSSSSSSSGQNNSSSNNGSELSPSTSSKSVMSSISAVIDELLYGVSGAQADNADGTPAPRINIFTALWNKLVDLFTK